MRTVTTRQKQSVFDIALQAMGSFEGVFAIMEMNPGLEFDHIFEPGTEIMVPDKPLNRRITDYYAQNGIIPTSEFEPVPVTIQATTNISLRGSFPVYSEVFDVLDLFGYVDFKIRMEFPSGSANPMTFAIETSYDGKYWNEVSDSLRNFVSETQWHIFRATEFAEGHWLRCRWTNMESIQNKVYEIIMTYEKYF
ncbi:MAG: hypothetical protein ACNA7V_06665 [Bacteroidales bacterium]